VKNILNWSIVFWISIPNLCQARVIFSLKRKMV
jgi:hypothetical protein